jgi:predicted dehydrogenase
MTVDELLADDAIDIVVNLTIPQAHGEIALRTIAAGKHAYCEKPLALSRDEGRRVLEAAKQKGVRVGCAPDTFLGAGQQTARKLVDDGTIGQVVAGTAFMLCGGHESWHPSPEFYYKAGGGPMFDMGPYYLTALINLLGPIRSVSGFSRITRPQRTNGSEPLKGTLIDVQTPDHVAGTLLFESGAIVNIATSFAVPCNVHPPITLFGSKGTMQVPDPNGFDGEVRVRLAGQKEFTTVDHTHTKGYGRSAGVADMAHAIRAGRPHRGSGDLAFGVLDAMAALVDTGTTGQVVVMQGRSDRPAPLPTGLAPGRLD